jgi:hypothetical protein
MAADWFIRSKPVSDIEKISAAAILCGDLLIVGQTHIQAVGKILSLPGRSGQEKAEFSLNAADGFVTNQGRFVDRQEACRIAQAAGQLREVFWNEAAKDGGNNDQTSELDSSWMEETYALVTSEDLAWAEKQAAMDRDKNKAWEQQRIVLQGLLHHQDVISLKPGK